MAEQVGTLNPHPRDDKNHRIGREISFGIQQTLACWATDFIDPYVSKWYQNKYGNQDHHVTGQHTWGGEIVGDSAAFFVYMFVKRAFTKPVDALTGGVKSLATPILERMGKRSLKSWAAEHHVSKQDATYQQKLEEYKNFQAENLVDSSIIALAATSLNVVAQRNMFGNKQGYGVILASKLIGAAATMSTMLGLRSAIPTTMKSLDDELSARYFSKVASGVKRLAGVEDAPAENASPATSAPSPVLLPQSIDIQRNILANAPMVEVDLDGDKKKSLARMLQQHAKGFNLQNEAEKSKFLVEEISMLDAMIEIFHPSGEMVRHMADTHYALTQKLYASQENKRVFGSDAELKLASLQSMQSIAVNRRDDLLALRKMLKDESARNALLQPPSALMTSADETASKAHKKEELIASILQPNPHTHRGEPAVHIYANAKGQALEHEILALCFNPKGSVARKFTEALQQHLPEMPAQKLEAIAHSYMTDREQAAIKVVQAFKLDSDVVTEAVSRSEQMRLNLQHTAMQAR